MSDVEKYCPDPLWQIARVLIPPHPKPAQGGGRRRIDDRALLAAILYVLGTGCSWWALPASFGVTRPTAHRRFSEWTKAGFFALLHQQMLDLLGVAGKIDWYRASVDTMHVRALKGGT